MSKHSARETTVLQRKGPRTSPLHEDQAQLVHTLGPRAGQRIQVEHGAVLGRDELCDVAVDDEGTSRRHARLGYDSENGFFIEDMGSRNGTFVNGVSIEHTWLAFGDNIAIGAHTVFLFTRYTPLDDQVIQAQKLQMLGELTGGIVHDFNNILAAFAMGMDLLREICGGDGEVDACLRDLDDAAARGADLTSQLLGFARGGVTQHDRIDLSQVTSDAARLLRRMVPQTVPIRTEITRGVGVHGSSSQILQVIVNLAINSADAMPDGGEIVIRVQRSGKHAILEVVDVGEGMDTQTLERAMDPFFTTKPRGHGTGLGLATVDRVAREHHGSVAVASEPGRGTTVTVTLPFAPPRDTTEWEDAQAPPVPPGTVVLMVDDDPVVRALTSRMLEAAGAQVLLAEDGLAGVEVFRDNASRISAVMLDLDLPRLSGEETFEMMREIQPDIPVLIASGYLGDERAHRLESSGVWGFMSKPFRRKSMLAMLVECMKSPARPEGTPQVHDGGEPASPMARADHPSDDSMELESPELAMITTTLDRDALGELLVLEEVQPGLLAEIAQIYLDQTPEQIDQIARACEPGSRAGLAHSLKGSSLSLGASSVGKVAAQIEAAARTNQATDHWLPTLRAAFDAIRPEIQALVDDTLRDR